MTGLLKSIFILLGTLSLGLGVAGIFIPGLPTTPFILLTAGLYVRSSDTLYRFLVRNKHLGRYVREYQTNKGLTLKTKLYSIVIMWIMILTSSLFLIHVLYIKLIVLAIGIAGTLVMGFLIPTTHKDIHKL